MKTHQPLPDIQTALELIGPGQLRLNEAKPVYPPGPYQIVAKVEAVGLCFSDLKLLKQFDQHPRKGEILKGIDRGILEEVSSYRPGVKSTVPGHEACCRIVAVGEKVRHHQVGQRVLVQTDYRWLKTKNSNGSFGYNFEGALQQYVLMDERVIVDPQTQESFLIPVADALSASAIALVEPWACVENSYITSERKKLRANGRLLVVADMGYDVSGLAKCLITGEQPLTIDVICGENTQFTEIYELAAATVCRHPSIDALPDGGYDDIIYFGADKNTIEFLDNRLATGGMLNIVLAGGKISEAVALSLGRVHYAGVRYIGTIGADPAESYQHIPDTGEVRDGDKVLIIGAAGPMGQMHVFRTICSHRKNISITATDLDDQRLMLLEKKAQNPARQHRVKLTCLNPRTQTRLEAHSYFTIMAPSAPLVASAIDLTSPGALLNLFAGISVGVKYPVNLQRYLENRCFMFGTSGSRLEDMKIVWDKVSRGILDTNISVDAVGGLAGAIEGIKAVEHGAVAGKIIIYPSVADMPLTTMARLNNAYPAIAARLNNGQWTKQAEDELLAIPGKGSS